MRRKGFATTGLLLLIVGLLVSGVAVFAYFKLAPETTQQISPPLINNPPNLSRIIVPDYVSLYLDKPVETNHKTPILILSAVAGGGCDSATDLQINEEYSENRLLIKIIGYNLTEGKGEVCPAVILESKAKIIIDMDWLNKIGDKKVVFSLGNQMNTYNIKLNNNKVTLLSINAVNVISNVPGNNPTVTPTILEITL